MNEDITSIGVENLFEDPKISVSLRHLTIEPQEIFVGKTALANRVVALLSDAKKKKSLRGRITWALRNRPPGPAKNKMQAAISES